MRLEEVRSMNKVGLAKLKPCAPLQYLVCVSIASSEYTGFSRLLNANRKILRREGGHDTKDAGRRVGGGVEVVDKKNVHRRE